jgi:hypothetical protein
VVGFLISHHSAKGDLMAWTYDLATNVGKVRMLVPDRVDVGHIFEDDEITAFLTMEGGAIKRAVAAALETIASDQAMTIQTIQLLHLKMDGTAVAKSLLDRAATLRDQSTSEEAVSDDGAFDIAEWAVTDFAYRERMGDQAQRGV